jgi:serine/threonine protein kinase
MTPQPPLNPLRRWDPERIGPYTLLGRLGAGAMGQVYLGRSTAGRLVAVKTIKIEFAEEAGFRTRFAHEVAAARRVSGVFTAAVVAADPEADVPWLATAYVPAPSLSRLVRATGPLPVPAARWLAAGCAEALESIHGAGLVHRDLKPSNVLVAPDGPRVIDFGVARAAERISLTVTRGAVGTPAYMAPEQARDTRQASMASDVFSLGATLLYAATGHAPYGGETVMDVLVRLATEAPDLTGVPGDLATLVTACLERSPRDRPTSSAVLEQLEPFVTQTPAPGAEHPYLSPPAVALIADYQRGPRAGAATRAGDEAVSAAEDTDGEDTDSGGTGTGDGSGYGEASLDSSEAGEATFGSQLVLPAAAPAQGRRWRLTGRSPGGNRAGRYGIADRTAGDAPARRPAWLAAGVSAAALVLLAAGAVGGALFQSGRPAPAPAGSPRVLLPPPNISIPPASGSRPQIKVLQPQGDGDTVFIVHGSDWPAQDHVTVSLSGHGPSPDRPVVDRVGTFNYAIDQGHLFFPGPIPVGRYKVVVTGPGGRRAAAMFHVVSGPPPGLPPPPG